MTEPVTAAQETVTNAMLIALIACGALSLAIIRWFGLSDPFAYAILAMTSFVVAGYIVPNITALWLGRPIHEIMTDGTPSEHNQARR